MKRFKLSLRAEIIINMTILMLAMIIFVSILVILISRKDIYLKKAEGSQELVQALSNLTAPVMTSDPNLVNEQMKRSELARITDTFFKNLPGSDIVIADTVGKVLYSSNKGADIKVVDDESFFEVMKLKIPLTQFKEVEKRIFNESPRKLFVYVPIMHSDSAIGAIVARFSLGKESFYAARSQSLILLFILLDAVLFILFGSFLLSRVIVTPIKKLVKATEKVAAGKLDYRVESFSTKEINSLSGSFNQMTKKLLASKKSLEEHVDSLEKVNQELKQAKDEVLRSEKLASVGRLATGIAHEVGNPLGSIFGYLEILSDDKDADLDDYIRRIHKECYRIDVIVKELLDYSRKHKFKLERVNLNELIESTCSATLHRKIFDGITCKHELDQALPDVTVDRMQLQQVFTNMIINSADAMGKTGGAIVLSTKTVLYRPELFSSTTLSVGDTLACLAVHDNGSGISQEDLNRIFDPFYTTKEPGKGTGLGLAISLRIIESFNGAITVTSETGKGATFYIYLPVRG